MTFNLRKRAYGNPNPQNVMDAVMPPQAPLVIPPGLALNGFTEADAHFLYNSNYDGGSLYDSPQDMINGMEEAQIMEELANSVNVDTTQERADAASGLAGGNLNSLASAKPFNLKKAQMPMPEAPMPEMPMPEDPMPEDPQSFKKYETHSDLNNMLIEVSNSKNAFQEAWNDIMQENPKEADSAQAALKSYFQGFEIKGEEQKLKDAEIIHELIYGKEDTMPIQAPYKEVGASVNEVSDMIKKLAQKHVGRHEKKAFNVTKTAQHKTMDNAIMWGPGQTRIDPFLHQPVSDWHIVERNKGFGLVVDDVWNIDYETIWRENVMDKYSRPYKNKEGDWVGGYINKRFEVDRNIPETNNMQLKPGQTRKPILPEYGNTESRLQAARAKGDIAGATDTSKPFNWKEASSKKKS
jgi:hypothetical protein